MNNEKTEFESFDKLGITTSLQGELNETITDNDIQKIKSNEALQKEFTLIQEAVSASVGRINEMNCEIVISNKAKDLPLKYKYSIEFKVNNNSSDNLFKFTVAVKDRFLTKKGVTENFILEKYSSKCVVKDVVDVQSYEGLSNAVNSFVSESVFN